MQLPHLQPSADFAPTRDLAVGERALKWAPSGSILEMLSRGELAHEILRSILRIDSFDSCWSGTR
jgi:hypothetical protein